MTKIFIILSFSFYCLSNGTPCTSDICTNIISKYKSLGHTVRDCTCGNNGDVYWRIEDLLTWNDAQDACQKFSAANLISVHNFDEKALLNNLAANNQNIPGAWTTGIYIGLRRQDFTCATPFIWSDASDIDYTDWITTQPDCYLNADACAMVFNVIDSLDKNTDNSVGWGDVPCTELAKSICKLILTISD